jgi:hypothetical protein
LELALGDPHLTAEGVARVGLVVIVAGILFVFVAIGALVGVVVMLMRGKR